MFQAPAETCMTFFEEIFLKYRMALFRLWWFFHGKKSTLQTSIKSINNNYLTWAMNANKSKAATAPALSALSFGGPFFLSWRIKPRRFSLHPSPESCRELQLLRMRKSDFTVSHVPSGKGKPWSLRIAWANWSISFRHSWCLPRHFPTHSRDVKLEHLLFLSNLHILHPRVRCQEMSKDVQKCIQKPRNDTRMACSAAPDSK